MSESKETTIEDYSDRSIVVRGDTRKFIDKFRALNGKWNPNLKDGTKGWIFSKSKKEKVEDIIKDILPGDTLPSNEPSAPNNTPIFNSISNEDALHQIKILQLELSSRIADLERRLNK